MPRCTWEATQSAKGKWGVIVNAPGTLWGGWVFFTDSEHDARLACDAMNYLTGEGDTKYTEEKWGDDDG